VIAVPGGEAPSSGRGHLRAAHADREQVIDTLKAAFVQGRLAKDEFDLRIGQALAARTYADLAAVTADIPLGPARPAAVPPPRGPSRTLTRTEKAAAWCLYSIVTTVIFTIAIVPGQTTVNVMILTAVVIYSSFWLLGGLMVIAARHGWLHPCAYRRSPGETTERGLPAARRPVLVSERRVVRARDIQSAAPAP
jgi:hypothetical protein